MCPPTPTKRRANEHTRTSLEQCNQWTVTRLEDHFPIPYIQPAEATGDFSEATMMEDWIFDSHNGATLHFREHRVRDGPTDIFDLFNSGPRRPPGRRKGEPTIRPLKSTLARASCPRERRSRRLTARGLEQSDALVDD